MHTNSKISDRLFNSTTLKILDFTKSIPTELCYHFTPIASDREFPTSYSKDIERYYQIDPAQIDVGVVSSDILNPGILNDILNTISDKLDFSMGFTTGQLDGYLHGKRKHMSTMRDVTWSYLIGYEYGVLTGTFYKTSIIH